MTFDDGEEEEEKDELERVEKVWACPTVAAPCAEKAGVVSSIGTIPVLLIRT